MKNSILLIDKPAGWTSFDVVAKIRGKIRAEQRAALQNEKGKRAAGAPDSFRAPRDEEKPLVVPHERKRVRVGHAGTLDPFATGLLIVLLGDATKRAGEFLKRDKIYEATVRLGQTSTTGDPEGDLTAVSDTIPTLAAVQEALNGLTGHIMQQPPAFSAIKVGGQRAYKLARQGTAVEIPARQVTIYALELLDYTYPDIKIRAHVSSGTYIRTLAADIGAALGTGAYCQALRRTAIGDDTIDRALTIDQAIEKPLAL